MKKFVLLFIAAIGISVSLSSCSKEEENTEATFNFSIKDQNSIGLKGFVYLFPNDEYDPSTFEASNITIKTTKGELVGVSYLKSTEKGKYSQLTCEAGTYYAIYHYLNAKSFTNTWKGETISIEGGKTKYIEFKLNTNMSGCQN
ncbi:MAG: hypothetical protein J5651_02245 [Salinivirgaceae bacterium]|nr:hypothetical protein [Salinivirgaceae bacterium]